MKRGWRLALSALGVVVAAVLVGAFFGKSGSEREPQASTENLPARFDEMFGRDEIVAVPSVDELLMHYKENEFAAAARYENVGSRRTHCLIDRISADGCRLVETSGTILDMGRDDRGVAYIKLATRNEFASVEARFGNAEDESLQTLRRGQRVAVRCMVLYETSAGLSLARCGVAS